MKWAILPHNLIRVTQCEQHRASRNFQHINRPTDSADDARIDKMRPIKTECSFCQHKIIVTMQSRIGYADLQCRELRASFEIQDMQLLHKTALAFGDVGDLLTIVRKKEVLRERMTCR